MESSLKETAGVKPVGRVLVLGGSSFIGYTTTVRLLEEKYSVHLANRGNTYWNHDLRREAGVTHIIADRSDPEQFAEALRHASTGDPWLAVVDFTAYRVADVECALKGLQENFGIYVYISTDSVYEVCCKNRWIEHSSVTEDQACRLVNPQDRHILNKMDRYGHRKLQCEEALQAFSVGRKKPVICLRLADVIGPFDDTERLWAYWWWCRYSHCSPIYLDEDGITQPLNFTYSGDVAAAVLHVIRQASTPESTRELVLSGGHSYFQAINIACQEVVTLKEFLVLLYAKSGWKEDIHFCSYTENDNVFPGEKKVFLPSVCRKAPLSLEKFKNVFKQTPTILEDALQKTCNWFGEAVCMFPDEAAKAALRIPRKARQRALAVLQRDRMFKASSSSSSSGSSSSGDSD